MTISFQDASGFSVSVNRKEIIDWAKKKRLFMTAEILMVVNMKT